jgi:hypothetical protein
MGGGFPFAADGCLWIAGLLPAEPSDCCSNILTSDLVGSMEVESVFPLVRALSRSSSMVPSSSLATIRSANLRCKAWARESKARDSSMGVAREGVRPEVIPWFLAAAIVAAVNEADPESTGLGGYAGVVGLDTALRPSNVSLCLSPLFSLSTSKRKVSSDPV